MSAGLEQRRRTHERLAARLTALSDDALAALLHETNAWRANGLGNQSGVIELDGAKLFVKKLALSDLERGADGSTANLFGLPMFYHYGVGSAGFGAWRELGACLRASDWALSGECPHFPLVHHWRVTPRNVGTPPLPEQLARVERGVAHWGHADGVRARLEAIVASTASIVLFIEHVPQTLHEWLASGVGGESDEAAIVRLHDQWRGAADFMNARGLLHFDLHRNNVLTDGESIYVADFGLALSAHFDLAADERAFFERHRLYDRAFVLGAVSEWLTPDEDPPPLTPALRALVDRYAPVAAVLREFFQALRERKAAPYPAAELEAALAAQAHAR